MRLSMLVGSLVVTFLVGCQLWTDNQALEELSGVWVTSAPAYVGCEFEIEQRSIIFRNRPHYSDVHRINRIKKSSQEKKIFYTIYYGNKKKGQHSLSFFYFTTPEGGMIQFKNQRQLWWTRKRIVPHASSLQESDLSTTIRRCKGCRQAMDRGLYKPGGHQA